MSTKSEVYATMIIWYTFLGFFLMMDLKGDCMHINQPGWTNLIGCCRQFMTRAPCNHNN